MEKIYTTMTQDDVAKHNSESDCYIIIDSLVYDVTKFLPLHPGGKKLILNYAGKDATDIFHYFHSDQIANKYTKLIVGQVPELKRVLKKPILEFPLSDQESSGLPYGDTLDTQGWYSPYYTDNHKLFRQKLRAFLTQHLRPHSDQWEEQSAIPHETYQKVCEEGLSAVIVGKPWDKQYFPQGKQIVLGMDLTGQLDIFYEYIIWGEFVKVLEGGSVASGIFGGNSIGLPPIAHFGSDYLKNKVLKPCNLGQKRCCLAITEPWVGSDVAGIKCSAVLSECKKFYIVNGIKKWITNGFSSDFFTCAVRTGDEGMMGISLLVIERNMPGFKMKKQLQQGIWTSGTAQLIFENVKVPVENLIGIENDGFKMIMWNFNHERLLICFIGVAAQTQGIAKMMEYTHKRETFGKKLIDHPVIRQKMSNIIRLSLNNQAMLENQLYNFENMKNKQKLQILPSSVALLKAHTSICNADLCNQMVQICGGLGYTREGQLLSVERAYREVKSAAILGGSEEIMLDLGMKLASRFMPTL